MSSLISNLWRRFNSVTFLRTFAMILAAELVTMCIAWFFIERSPSRWVKNQVDHLNEVSVAAAHERNDWALVADVPKERKSPLFRSYQATLKVLEHKSFPHGNGDLYLGIIKGTQEWTITSADADLWDVTFKPDVWELESISSGQTSYTSTPHTDDTGTYLASSTPVFRNGKVVAVVVAEGDALQLGDLEGLVVQAFWLSMPPALLISLMVAIVLASMFAQPTEVLREIAVAAQSQRARSPEEEERDPWHQLTAKQKEIAALLLQGVEHYDELAEALSVTPETIKKHFKNIKESTGWSKQRLAIEAAARRAASSLQPA